MASSVRRMFPALTSRWIRCIECKYSNALNVSHTIVAISPSASGFLWTKTTRSMSGSKEIVELYLRSDQLQSQDNIPSLTRSCILSNNILDKQYNVDDSILVENEFLWGCLAKSRSPSSRAERRKSIDRFTSVFCFRPVDIFLIATISFVSLCRP